MLSLSVPAAALANGSLHIVGGRYQVPPAGDEASVLQTELAAEACRICAPAHAKRISIDREGCRDRAGCSGATALGAKVGSASSRRASAPRTLRHCMGPRPERVDQTLSAGVSVSACKLEACCARSTRARYRCV